MLPWLKVGREGGEEREKKPTNPGDTKTTCLSCLEKVNRNSFDVPLLAFSPSVSNHNTSSAYFWLNLKGEKPLLLGYVNWLQKNKIKTKNRVPLFSEIVGNKNNKKKKEKKDSMLYQGTGAFNCTYNTISSKARVSDETTQPL